MWFQQVSERTLAMVCVTVILTAFIVTNPMMQPRPRLYGFGIAARGAECAWPNFPNLNCVGVPPGTVFNTTINGDYEPTANQVIDGWDIQGNLLIFEDNITIRNSRIRGGIFNQWGSTIPTINAHPYTVTDSELGPDQCTDARSRIAALQSANYTARRVYIHDVDHGMDFSEPGNVDVQDSLMTLCWLDEVITPPDGSHVDGVQSLCGLTTCSGLNMVHNSIDDGIPNHGTFAINLVDVNLRGPVNVEKNLLWGANNYVIYTHWRAGSTWTIKDNRLVNGSWLPTLVPTTAEGCEGQSWTGNYAAEINGSYTDSYTGPNQVTSIVGSEIACG